MPLVSTHVGHVCPRVLVTLSGSALRAKVWEDLYLATLFLAEFKGEVTTCVSCGEKPNSMQMFTK